MDRSGARSKPLGNDLERVDVAAAVVQGTAKVMVEGVAVAVAEATGISDSRLAFQSVAGVGPTQLRCAVASQEYDACSARAVRPAATPTPRPARIAWNAGRPPHGMSCP